MKVVVIIIGVIVGLIGVACVGSGAALGVAIGTDGWIESDEGRLDTTTHAVVSEVADIANEDRDAAEFFHEVEFKLRVDVQAQEGDDVFVGVGPAGDVTAYLAGVEQDLVNDIEFDPLRLDKIVVPGQREPGQPGDETFWVEQVSGGGRQVLDWDIDAGAYRFVLMNSDGSAGVDTQGTFALKIPYVTGIMITLFVAGGVALLIGIVMIVLAVRSGSGRAQAPPPASTEGTQPPEHSPST